MDRNSATNNRTNTRIARNQVFLNQIFRRILDKNAGTLADRNSTGNISANAIADYLVVARSDAGNLDADAGNTGNNSGLAEDSVALDPIIWNAINPDPPAVAPIDRTRKIGADMVAGDRIAAIGLQADACQAKSVDR